MVIADPIPKKEIAILKGYCYDFTCLPFSINANKFNVQL